MNVLPVSTAKVESQRTRETVSSVVGTINKDAKTEKLGKSLEHRNSLCRGSDKTPKTPAGVLRDRKNEKCDRKSCCARIITVVAHHTSHCITALTTTSWVVAAVIVSC